ncbi:MAG TPA: CDP-glycerol glycerophosphotransferase family protein [Streptosporangiaceae bacterium]|nr:CDP-glycerol glycerophosphotransferase family protein [Streptosporangiaceae bacterium]
MTFATATAELALLKGRGRHRFLAKALGGDLRAILDTLPEASAQEREEVMAAAAEFTRGVPSRVFRDLPALTRLKWHLAQRGLIAELVKVIRYERGRNKPTIRRDPLRRYVVYPYWKDDKLQIPKQVFLARHEVKLRSSVHTVRWEGGRLTVTGEAAINSVSSRHRWTSVLGVALRHGRRRVPVLTRRTAKKGQWTGFTFTVDPRRLRRFGRWVDGEWEVRAGLFNSGVYRGRALGGGKYQPPHHYVSEDVRIVPAISGGAFRLRVETVRARAVALDWAVDTLVVSGIATSEVSGLRLVQNDVVVPVPVETVEGGGFTAIVPLELLGAATGSDTRHWDFAVLLGDIQVPLVMADEVPAARQLIGTEEAVASAGPGGYLRLTVRTARLALTGCGLREDGTLVLSGRHPIWSEGEIVLRNRQLAKSHVFPMTFDGELRASLPLAAVPTVAGALPLFAGSWDVLFRPPRGQALNVAAEMLPQHAEVALRGYTANGGPNGLTLRVTSNLMPEERKASSRLRDEARRSVARTGLRDAVLFSSFNGRQYADNPRAIHEELVRRGYDLELLWAVSDGQVLLPSSAREVRLYGQEWHEAVASSRYIVINHRFGDWFERHPDQVVLQTWHGTPLKKIGRDVKEVHFAYSPPSLRKAEQAASQTPAIPDWSYLLSPNPFSTKIMRHAFRFKGELIEAGYPRNDVLYSADAPARAASVRAAIGIPPGKKVVLYAPTWRDDQYYRRGHYKLDWRIDLDRFAAVLGDDHVLLVRVHPNVVDGPPEHELVHHVSLYPDISELFLITDVLVTDYSSVMFDFANTRKPQLFYTYDLPHYRDILRGFYFDFESEAPGPLLETSDALIEAIRSIDSVSASYQKAYDAFIDRFCPLDDGKAAARVVDRVFSS